MSEPEQDSKMLFVITRGALTTTHDDDSDDDVSGSGVWRRVTEPRMHASQCLQQVPAPGQEFTENIDWAICGHTCGQPGLASGYNKPIIITIFYAKYFTVYLESEFLMSCLIHNSDLLKGLFELMSNGLVFCCALLTFLTTMKL